MADASRSATDRTFDHEPVMVAEIVADLGEAPAGVVLDATLGGAGHASAVLDSWDHLELVGIDRDPEALAAADTRLAPYGSRARTARARFDQLDAVLDDLGVDEVAGFLFDLGVSSPQLDWDDRGFSFRHEGPLDMRMDPDGPRTASDFVNAASEREIATALQRNADERFARRIAKAIVAARPIHTTTELADVVVAAIPAPARRTGGHPAKRTFQAIRIEVNEELSMLAPALDAAIDRLAPGGRGLVLTYHSGEDRIVKQTFRARTDVVSPPGLPVDPDPTDFLLIRPAARTAAEAEISSNRRASSARLRGIRRREAVIEPMVTA
jgi:16S rRNA (cytosine1402-N4)-methyltransferase